MTAGTPTLTASPTRRGVPRAVWRFARPHRRLLAVAVTLGVAASLATTVVPVLVGRITDALLDRAADLAVTLAVVGVVLAVAQVVLAAVSRSLLARAGEHLVRDVRDRVAEHLATTSLRFVERHRAGELLQRSTAEIAALSTFVRESVTEIVVTAATVVLLLGVLAVESWLLTIVLVVVFLPPSLFVLHRFRSRAGAAFGAEAAAEAEVAADVAESIRVRELVVAAPARTRDRLAARADALNADAVTAQMRTVVLSRWIGAMSLVEGVTVAALVGVGAVLVAADRISVGVVVTFVLAGVTLFARFSDLVSLAGDLEEAATGAARTHELLEASRPTAPAATPRTADAAAPTAHGGLHVEDVWFGYGDDPVLRGVTWHLPAGSRCGVAGPSGAGKSTLATLVAGLYRPDRGTVRWGGVDLATVPEEDRAALVAFVPQEVQLGRGTIADELRLADPDATDARLLDVAARLGLAAWLRGLPAGLATPVGAGAGLSAGERQLVGILRVGLLDSAAIVLDEATSDVDPATAALVEDALDRLAAGRTVLVVAHRPATLDRLDRVVEVVDGTVVDRARR